MQPYDATAAHKVFNCNCKRKTETEQLKNFKQLTRIIGPYQVLRTSVIIL